MADPELWDDESSQSSQSSQSYQYWSDDCNPQLDFIHPYDRHREGYVDEVLEINRQLMLAQCPWLQSSSSRNVPARSAEILTTKSDEPGDVQRESSAQYSGFNAFSSGQNFASSSQLSSEQCSRSSSQDLYHIKRFNRQRRAVDYFYRYEVPVCSTNSRDRICFKKFAPITLRKPIEHHDHSCVASKESDASKSTPYRVAIFISVLCAVFAVLANMFGLVSAEQPLLPFHLHVFSNFSSDPHLYDDFCLNLSNQSSTAVTSHMSFRTLAACDDFMIFAELSSSASDPRKVLVHNSMSGQSNSSELQNVTAFISQFSARNLAARFGAQQSLETCHCANVHTRIFAGHHRFMHKRLYGTTCWRPP